MKARYSLLALFSLVVAMAVLVTGCGGSPQPTEEPSPDPSSPAGVVESFYRWYVGYPGNPMADGAYRSSEYLSEDFVQEVGQLIASFEGGGYDPFLCAQDIPGRVDVDEATVSGDEASVMVYGVWNPDTEFELVNEVEVELRRMDGQWKITDIICLAFESETEAPVPPPAETVERFYNWYLARARTAGSPLADGSYRETGFLTEELVQKIDALVASFEGGAYDPFLCAQDVSERVDVGPAEGSAEEAGLTVRTSFEGHSFRVELQLVAGEWKISDVICSGASQPGDAVSYQEVEIPEVGLSFEVPEGWQRLEPDWVWAPDAEGSLRLGANWMELEPPMEAEAALLPGHAQVLASEPVQLIWGSGRSFTVEVYAPTAEEGGTQAPVESYEIHTLIVFSAGDVRRAVDLYASAATVEDLDGLRPALQHMLDSSGMAAAIQSDCVEAVPGWQIFRDEEHGYQIQVPPDWTPYEIELTYPEMSAPIARIVQFLPQTWADQLNSRGAPDPNAPVVVAPLSLEVSVGTLEEYRRMYAEPAVSETFHTGCYAVTREEDVAGDNRLIRTIFQHPVDEILRVTLVDQLSGFSSRVPGNEDVIATAEQMINTFEFIR
jgi:hypothetical protein